MLGTLRSRFAIASLPADHICSNYLANLLPQPLHWRQNRYEFQRKPRIDALPVRHRACDLTQTAGNGADLGQAALEAGQLLEW
jgi:hypothetical protein